MKLQYIFNKKNSFMLPFFLIRRRNYKDSPGQRLPLMIISFSTNLVDTEIFYICERRDQNKRPAFKYNHFIDVTKQYLQNFHCTYIIIYHVT